MTSGIDLAARTVRIEPVRQHCGDVLQGGRVAGERVLRQCLDLRLVLEFGTCSGQYSAAVLGPS